MREPARLTCNYASRSSGPAHGTLLITLARLTVSVRRFASATRISVATVDLSARDLVCRYLGL